ncbi:MAG: hypothetical protein AAGF12_24610 [Myxococcota bacterium]
MELLGVESGDFGDEAIDVPMAAPEVYDDAQQTAINTVGDRKAIITRETGSLSVRDRFLIVQGQGSFQHIPLLAIGSMEHRQETEDLLVYPVGAQLGPLMRMPLDRPSANQVIPILWKEIRRVRASVQADYPDGLTVSEEELRREAQAFHERSVTVHGFWRRDDRQSVLLDIVWLTPPRSMPRWPPTIAHVAVTGTWLADGMAYGPEENFNASLEARAIDPAPVPNPTPTTLPELRQRCPDRATVRVRGPLVGAGQGLRFASFSAVLAHPELAAAVVPGKPVEVVAYIERQVFYIQEIR